ncbi:MAG: tyrosine--tRNA ligase [Candidatus Jacksonbacteria bacterium]|jgi:tyrosyl-tRNA synthetase|nr:tyrosine--tRNA ligase [Candidatus Jacksonbacteria bacterium]MBT6301694.1 tyrosine--tRNA ligase [Candidatus Jacksonbacteria bacterium]
MTNKEKIEQVLTRGVSEVLVKDNLRKKLLSGKKLRVKLGIDPSGADLHLGHMVVLRKLREFQELGHQIVLVVGTFTGQIGDPTGKMEARPPKTEAELQKNAEHYVEQAAKMIDTDDLEIRPNSEWFNDMTFKEVIRLASSFTAQQMMHRDMFKQRVKQKQEIYLHEFMYPLMQGYDSVELKADVELGGTDQTFNLLAGRTIQEMYGQNPQNIVTVPILEGTDGVQKMGKSLNNYIGVLDTPENMFGRVMSISDELIIKYFELTTFVSTEEIKELKKSLKTGENPRNVKARLGKEIVTIYHSEEQAQKALEAFDSVFKEGALPEDIPEVEIEGKGGLLVDALVTAKLVSSKSEARRMIEQGAVKMNQEKVSGIDTGLAAGEVIVQVGKRKIAKFIQK